jgi:hypothetical protein
VNSSAFDRLFAEGREALLSGSYKMESAPVDGVARWGIGAVLRPDPVAAQAIEQVTVAVAGIVGDNHWLPGTVRSSHLTLRRGLEPYRSSVPVGDPLIARYSAALRTAVNGTGPLRFSVIGLTLTPVSVMACAVPADTGPDDLVEAYGRALSAEGCGLAGRAPDIWYLNLVYFTGPVRDAQALTEWIAARREAYVTNLQVTDIQLVRWHHTNTGMAPEVLTAVKPHQPGETI